MRYQAIFKVLNITILIFSLASMELQAKTCEGNDYEQWSNCQGSYTWSDGANYTGGWDNGNLNGYGVYTFEEGNAWSVKSYKGFYKNDDMHGYGILTWQDGGYYEGDFVKNDPHGYGVHIYISGNQYEGFYKHGLQNGEGTYNWTDGSSYTGSWKNGDQDGFGTFRYSNGDIYEGNFKADLRHGAGKMTHADGLIYEGNWINDEIENFTPKVVNKENSSPNIEQCPEDTSLEWTDCYGAYSYSDGNRYSGSWKDNLRHGQGVLYFKDGEKLSGSFAYGLLEGKGKYYFSNGDTYEGNFRNSLMHGEGEIIHDDGSILTARWYQGEIVKITIQLGNSNSDEVVSVDDEYITKCPYSTDVLWNNCFVKAKLSDEIEFEGVWRNDRPDGFGRAFYNEELAYQGGFKDGLLDGLGELTLSNDLTFRGMFKNGLKDGKGRITQDGSEREIHGTWINGDLNGDFIIITESGDRKFHTYDYEEDIFQNEVSKLMSKRSQ